MIAIGSMPAAMGNALILKGTSMAGTESASDFVSDDAHPPRDSHSNNQGIIRNGHQQLDFMVDSNRVSPRFRGRGEPRS
jgi:hypothetical protein